jgi:pimeloyl-ACP methyl ester carboxylesterase
MIARTWGKMELKRPGARDAFAAEIAAGLPLELRELFLVGCGLLPGGAALLEAALGGAAHAFRFADPRPALARLRAPVIIVHGRDDDVIPWLEADKLRAALPPGHPHRVFLTGMYGHTGAERPRLRDLVRESRTLLGLTRAVIDAPRGLLR